MSAEHTAHSRKPSNIIVEFDIGTSFENLAQAGLLSNDPLATFASISALCALVSRRTQIELDPETGFVYWVAYDNRHDGWEIHKRELTGLASKESKSGDVPFELTEDDVEGLFVSCVGIIVLT